MDQTVNIYRKPNPPDQRVTIGGVEYYTDYRKFFGRPSISPLTAMCGTYKAWYREMERITA